MKWFGRKSKQAITEVSVEGPSDPLVVEENVLQKSILDLQDEITTQFIDVRNEINLLSSHLAQMTQPGYDTIDEDAYSETPDAEYAAYLRRFLEFGEVTNLQGKIIALTVIGTLRDGSLAWFNENVRACGVVSTEKLVGMKPLPDDTLRAKVVSHIWGHLVESVVPGSLQSPFATRAPLPTSSSWGAELREQLEEVRNTWKENLRPGDVVLARVPFDGHFPVDRFGRIAKDRPSVFLRWEHDYALLRAIYDASGYVADRELGEKLKDTNCLQKSSVVRLAAYDIKPAHLVKRIGRLGDKDLEMLHLPLIPELGIREIPSLRFAPLPSSPDLLQTEVTLTHLQTLLLANKVMESNTSTQLSSLFDSLIDTLCTEKESLEFLSSTGISFSMIGQIFHEILSPRNLVPPKGAFNQYMQNSLITYRTEDDRRIERKLDLHGLPILKITKRYSLLQIDSTYRSPDLIVIDQEALKGLLGDARLDPGQELTRLQNGNTAPGFLIGSDDDSQWGPLRSAAEVAGWKILSTNSREDLMAVVKELAQSHDAEVITVVSHFSDLIADLENVGYEVNPISELE